MFHSVARLTPHSLLRETVECDSKIRGEMVAFLSFPDHQNAVFTPNQPSIHTWAPWGGSAKTRADVVPAHSNLG